MKKSFIYAIAILLLAFGIAVAAKSKIKYRVFAPGGAEKKTFVKLNEKKYSYFELEKGKTIGFDVTGPTRVKIKTRALLPAALKSGSYEIQIWEGDKLITGRKAQAGVSKATIDNLSGQVGIGKNLKFKVPRGKHSYRVWIKSDDTDKFMVRFYQQKPARKKITYISKAPDFFSKKVKVPIKNSQVSYYVVDHSGGAKLSVVGPTKIKILCRAAFDHNMKGRSKFTLGVFENNSQVQMFSSMAEPSAKLMFAEMTDLIPSDLHTYILSVPSGKHTFEFRKMNSAAPNLAVRFKIQKDSVGKKK